MATKQQQQLHDELEAETAESYVPIVRKRQGATARLLCYTERNRGEKPSDAQWWHNGRPMVGIFDKKKLVYKKVKQNFINGF